MLALSPLVRRFAALAAVAALVQIAAPVVVPAPALATAAVTPLVDVAWLLDNAGRDDLVVLDVRNELSGGSEAVYRAGHIPGAVYSNYLKSGWRTEIDGVPAQLPRLEGLEALIGELGISNDSQVVIVSGGTDAHDYSSAARVYWTFKVVGHDRVSILDGGYRAYAADPANPVDTGWVDPLPDIFSAELRPELLADRPAVEAAAAAGRPLIDNRPREYFLGEKRHTWAKRAGTIPGAVSIVDSALVEDGHIIGAARAAQVLADAGLATAGQGPDQETITFCNTGHWSALGWFVQSEILGRKSVRVYDGSMVDWTAKADLPLQLGAAAAN
mgnify:CR=1 FL=1